MGMSGGRDQYNQMILTLNLTMASKFLMALYSASFLGSSLKVDNCQINVKLGGVLMRGR